MSRRILAILLLVMTSLVQSQCPAKCSCRNKNRELDCSGQDLVKLPDPPFSKVIRSLDLSRNRIPILKDEVFLNHQIMSLKSLIIADNKELSHIENGAFDGLPALKLLDLSGNDIAALDSEVFENLVGLDTLILNRNPLVLPDNGFVFESLQSLSMIECGLLTIPSNFFEHMSTLTYLNLASNELISFDSKIVSSLVVLETLDISRNKLTNPRQVISDLPLSVKELQFGNNEWTCDCDLKSVESSYLQRFIEQEFMCSSPPEFRKNVITEDLISKVVCVTTTEEIVVVTEEHVDVDDDFDDVQADFQAALPDEDVEVDEEHVLEQEEKNERIQMPPVREQILSASDKNIDDIFGAGVGGVATVDDDGNWASANQWWLVGGAAFAIMIGIIVVLMIQVRRFGKRQYEHGTDSETQYL